MGASTSKTEIKWFETLDSTNKYVGYQKFFWALENDVYFVAMWRVLGFIVASFVSLAMYNGYQLGIELLNVSMKSTAEAE